MEFNNLRRNILARLGKSWRQSNGKNSFLLDRVRSDYSDIPPKEVEGAIRSLHDEGLILLSGNNKTVRLTRDGLNRLRVIKDLKHDNEIVTVKAID